MDFYLYKQYQHKISLTRYIRILDSTVLPQTHCANILIINTYSNKKIHGRLFLDIIGKKYIFIFNKKYKRLI